MHSSANNGLREFKNYVGIKFQLYNSLFTALPFHRIEKTGILLSLLLNDCEEGYAKKLSPTQIINEFFAHHGNYTTQDEQLDLLFRFIQFIERQVVLFDALEDAAFDEVHDLSGPGTLKQLVQEVQQHNKEAALEEVCKDFSVRMVLTAHPTQFYPGTVLGIINDLSRSLAQNNATQIDMYLQQLGKTAFLKKQKPTPYDEAVSLIWYLENVFYNAAGRISSFMRAQFPQLQETDHSLINMGFWPGGDRDGNPFVNAETTLKVAEALRGSIIKCYYLDVRKLRRRLTFKGMDQILNDLEKQLYNNIFIPGQRTAIDAAGISSALNELKQILVTQHNGLFLHLLENLINKVSTFGLHFASLDIRQESSVHHTVLSKIAEKAMTVPADYPGWDEQKRRTFLAENDKVLTEVNLSDELATDTLESIHAIKTIQEYNGEKGCHRYIISQCNSALNVMEVYGLFILCGWQKANLTVDIVPLFETIDDLQRAAGIMKQLYSNDVYAQHLGRRKKIQTIMLGFSDGTKDGGYLMANWSIYKAKQELTAISRSFGIEVIFFDGRGGPPARGGGKTHQFYASMGRDISNKEIQLTIQGQTVSSNFGTIDSARYNLEQMINAGISNELFSNRHITLEADEALLMQQLAEESFSSYSQLKNHPGFLEYLAQVSPLVYYNETNIASRPSRRSAGKLTLKDLRAVPFVGAWSQLKQNVTGYYGVGTALSAMEKAGKFSVLKKLYKQSLFFKTLIDNCEMAMKKCFFPLTEHLRDDDAFGDLWKMIFDEYQLTEKYILQLSDKEELMDDYPVERLSILMRERIVLPLVTIQQYAIAHLRDHPETHPEEKEKTVFEKLIIRASFGIINAGRNSA
ncbi:MAG: phosphoenolpyruvate carboxylase [Ferruginibacter sp.]|nr:phosphoenolpyruvate carboxylase [Ferruginibacter sp.]